MLELSLLLSVIAAVAGAAWYVHVRQAGRREDEPVDLTNPWDAAPVAAQALLFAWPGLGAVTAVAIAVTVGADAPAELVTHWGAGGADGTMPRAFAIAVPVAMSVVCGAWSTVYALRHRRGPHVAADTAVVCGMFSWIGVACLSASLVAGRDGHLAVLFTALSIAGTIAVAVLVHRSGRRVVEARPLVRPRHR